MPTQCLTEWFRGIRMSTDGKGMSSHTFKAAELDHLGEHFQPSCDVTIIMYETWFQQKIRQFLNLFRKKKRKAPAFTLKGMRLDTMKFDDVVGEGPVSVVSQFVGKGPEEDQDAD